MWTKNPRGVDHNSAFGMSPGSDSLQKLSNGGMPQHDRRSPLTNSWWTKPWGKHMYRKYLGHICVTQIICTILCIFVGNHGKSWEVHVQQKYPSSRRWCKMSSTLVKQPPIPQLIGTPDEMNHRLPVSSTCVAIRPREETETYDLSVVVLFVQFYIARNRANIILTNIYLNVRRPWQEMATHKNKRVAIKDN